MHGLEDVPSKTVSSPLPGPAPSSLSPASRVSLFQPGQVFAERYRILRLLGRGGMGEVYGADDLRLEQPVALKFLRKEIAADPHARERFLSEVRLARAVTHPNVCRVHDVGEHGELLYLSMEYVDGEDLAGLLRRIGTPNRRKAVELAAQICAGLAAAHAKGVLHRDLKPANVMIDGTGRVRIADFGLAMVVNDERQRGCLAGTPAYMAPEQLAGGDATVKSDVYALGLVLYELFSGSRAWLTHDLAELRQLHATRGVEPLSTHVRIDERIERAILACLARDPARRPSSPIAVAAALTGADPIAAALAAGETPTPEMVAASGGEGRLSVPVARGLAAAILAMFGALLFVTPRASLHGRVPLELEPTVLAHRAREILESVGLAVEGGDRAFGLAPMVESRPSDQADSAAFVGQFWYREAPFSLQPSTFGTRLSWDNPPTHWAGMVSLGLSTRGKLRWLEAIPPSSAATSGAGSDGPPSCDWEPLFSAAGLSPADFHQVEPQRRPTQRYDERAAWVGPHPERAGVDVTIEGAAFHGRPTSFAAFEVPLPVTPWTAGSDTAHLVQFWLWLPALIGGIALARRNLLNGRGDRRAAAWLAVAIGLGQLSVALLRAHHTTNLLREQAIVVEGLSLALYLGAFVWLLYLALEPYVRRLWPDHLVSWSRLLSGRWRDPLVARDLLVGLGAGLLATLLGAAQAWIGMRIGAPGAAPLTANFPDPGGLAGMIARLCSETIAGVRSSFLLLFGLVALRYLVRRSWIAYALFAPLVLLANPFANLAGNWVLDWSGRLGLAALLLLVVARFGFFALSVAVATFFFLSHVPLTNELTSWYGGQTIFAALVLGGLTFAGARLASTRRTARAA